MLNFFGYHFCNSFVAVKSHHASNSLKITLDFKNPFNYLIINLLLIKAFLFYLNKIIF